MPSYQIDACKNDANGNSVLVESLEFEARDTPGARARGDVWSKEKALTASGVTVVRLYAGRALISERVLEEDAWKDAARP